MSGRIIVAEISSPEDVERVLNEAFSRAGYKVGGDLPETPAAAPAPEQPAAEKLMVPYDELVKLISDTKVLSRGIRDDKLAMAIKDITDSELASGTCHLHLSLLHDGSQAAAGYFLDQIKAKWGPKQ